LLVFLLNVLKNIYLYVIILVDFILTEVI